MGEIGYLFNLIFIYPIFNILMLLYGVLHDFGLSIIILTIVVKLVLFPLTLKQLKSMKATQALQPQLNELKKKYKTQQEQAVAMQALYKEYGLSPIGGTCLPTLIQLPVLFGLFYALSNVVRGGTLALYKHDGTGINQLIYPFLPKFQQVPNLDLNWFTFINHSWHFSLAAADPTHILPILAGLATLAQLRMSQQKTAAASSDMMAQQMKIMQLISPIMIVVIGWNYAAGLALYWTTSSLFAMVQQYFVTGWGSLLVTPNLVSNKAGSNGNGTVENSKVLTEDQAKNNRSQRSAIIVDADVVDSGPTTNKSQSGSYTNSNGSSARRRSASARRRSSNNALKKNVSRG